MAALILMSEMWRLFWNLWKGNGDLNVNVVNFFLDFWNINRLGGSRGKQCFDFDFCIVVVVLTEILKIFYTEIVT